MITSPYVDCDESEWLSITKKLVDDFPLDNDLIVKVVHDAWDDIYTSSFGDDSIKIGSDIFLPAQATGVILEKLIAVRLHNICSNWRGGETKTEKDIVRKDDNYFSFEIKTSSSNTGLYGNRSTGHRSANRSKHRSGYYLVINYKLPKEDDKSNEIKKIRFGWIDDDDWKGQAKSTGQQASIGAALARLKLIIIFPRT
ncbi:MAG: ScaI family restriction endonuclease [Robiginitomaculum sp.]|nr:ScaI family restriction endonuclease [Robiginitomaculum sp.]